MRKNVRKWMVLSLVVLLILVTGCGTVGNNAADAGSAVEAVNLFETTYYIQKGKGPDGNLQGDLLSIRSSIEKPQPGALYEFTLEDTVRDSYPAQAEAKSGKLLSEDSGIIKADFSLATSLLDHMPDKTHLIDVRTPEEYAQGHLPKSLNISSEVITDQIETAVSNKEDVVLLYCRSGMRAQNAAKSLKSMGYTTVFNLGGIQEYQGEIEK